MKFSSLGDLWPVTTILEDGVLRTPERLGFMVEVAGLEGSFLTPDQWSSLQFSWRSVFRFLPGEELQVVFRKRVEFSSWVEDQLKLAFMAENPYGRRLVLDRLAAQVEIMARDQPEILTQKIIACFWMPEASGEGALRDKRRSLISQLSAVGLKAREMDRLSVEREVCLSAQDQLTLESSPPEWPEIHIEAGHVEVNQDIFRSLEMTRLPERQSELGMIQSLTSLPYPIDVAVRITALDLRPIVSRLERKRNLLNSQRQSRESPSPQIESQLQQIDEVLRSLADRSECVFDLRLVAGVRFPRHLAEFQRHALASLIRAGAQMDFCEFEEATLHTFDCYQECIPGFKGKNIRSHTVLGSNAIHFLPLLRPAKGDRRPVISFQTRESGLFGIDPVDRRLANYNWLVTGTSGSGKSFFVNSLIGQSAGLEPNIFIVDIGGSYNKLTQFLGGRVYSLEPDQGFSISPFFLPPSADAAEEAMRRQHILQIFLEMAREDGHLPGIEIRHVLNECLNDLFAFAKLPKHPITWMVENLNSRSVNEARHLALLLEPWSGSHFFARFLDNANFVPADERILTYDLKGLTEFPDLSRVVQLIVCAALWAKIRQNQGLRFSWIVLDEVAFSLLKTQPQFVDELVSTLRKYFAGAIIVVQDLEKVTSNLAGSSILQNTQSKAILQQRGDPKNYAEALTLSEIDQLAIASLQRERGAFSEIFLIRDMDKAIIRHVPSELEYWLATTAPEDNREMSRKMKGSKEKFQGRVLQFLSNRAGGQL